MTNCPSGDLHIITGQYPRLGEGFLEELEEYILDNQDCRLVVIDTLQRARPVKNFRGGTSYEIDSNTEVTCYM